MHNIIKIIITWLIKTWRNIINNLKFAHEITNYSIIPYIQDHPLFVQSSKHIKYIFIIHQFVQTYYYSRFNSTSSYGAVLVNIVLNRCDWFSRFRVNNTKLHRLDTAAGALFASLRITDTVPTNRVDRGHELIRKQYYLFIHSFTIR